MSFTNYLRLSLICYQISSKTVSIWALKGVAPKPDPTHDQLSSSCILPSLLFASFLLYQPPKPFSPCRISTKNSTTHASGQATHQDNGDVSDDTRRRTTASNHPNTHSNVIVLLFSRSALPLTASSLLRIMLQSKYEHIPNNIRRD